MTKNESTISFFLTIGASGKDSINCEEKARGFSLFETLAECGRYAAEPVLWLNHVKSFDHALCSELLFNAMILIVITSDWSLGFNEGHSPGNQPRKRTPSFVRLLAVAIQIRTLNLVA